MTHSSIPAAYGSLFAYKGSPEIVQTHAESVTVQYAVPGGEQWGEPCTAERNMLLWKQHPNLFACSQSSVHRDTTVGGRCELEMHAVNINWSATHSLPRGFTLSFYWYGLITGYLSRFPRTPISCSAIMGSYWSGVDSKVTMLMSTLNTFFRAWWTRTVQTFPSLHRLGSPLSLPWVKVSWGQLLSWDFGLIQLGQQAPLDFESDPKPISLRQV